MNLKHQNKFQKLKCSKKIIKTIIFFLFYCQNKFILLFIINLLIKKF